MKFKDSQFVQDLLERNELPTIPVETYISDQTIYKFGIVLLSVLLIFIIVLRLTQSSKNAE